MLRWKSVWIPTVIGLFCWPSFSRADDAGQKAVAETRQALRQEGFKTDLADFDLSTTPELRAREAILMEAVTEPTQSGYKSHQASLPTTISWDSNPLYLMENVESNSAVVVWKLVWPEKPWPHALPLYSWADFHKAVDAKGTQLDRAAAAIFAGPIRFDLSRHERGHRIPPPVNQIKYLMRLLEKRLVLALHDGNLTIAWTNLLATTRLVTAWEPEPPQKCHLTRFETTERAFEATWQALQTNGWSEAQLARLQAEWESVDYFTNLADTAAYQRASDADFSQRERLRPKPYVLLGEFMAWTFRFPVIVWQGLNEEWQREQYLQHGSYVDEVTMLLHDSDAELELRRAVQAPTWSAMRRSLGILRPPSFKFQAMDNNALLGRAAVAESQRRILVATLALERYHARHGTYPDSLSGLAPEFVRKPPLDFMDGEPLRYRLTDGHFIIYSVGLGCVDRGGRLPPHKQFAPLDNGFARLSGSAIVWPLPASLAAVEAARLDDSTINQRRLRGMRP
jgi:hypothetical protein